MESSRWGQGNRKVEFINPFNCLYSLITPSHPSVTKAIPKVIRIQFLIIESLMIIYLLELSVISFSYIKMH